jgi:hypothetical protein
MYIGNDLFLIFPEFVVKGNYRDHPFLGTRQGFPPPGPALRRSGPLFRSVYTYIMYRTVHQMNKQLNEHVMTCRRNIVPALFGQSLRRGTESSESEKSKYSELSVSKLTCLWL